jgi:hypothetical protein
MQAGRVDQLFAGLPHLLDILHGCTRTMRKLLMARAPAGIVPALWCGKRAGSKIAMR